MKKAYLVWNLTNYGAGYEMLGVYTTKAKAEKAYKEEMKRLYGTADKRKLIELWEDVEDGCVDSWQITTVYLYD